jgi:serine/threonine-protein kinase HipA
MTNSAEVSLWGRKIGAVLLETGKTVAAFEYDKNFVESEIQVSPFEMPLSSRIYTFPALPPGTFYGLPGLLADSLPDTFGNALIDAWLARSGRESKSFSAVERLCYTGTRGMGALEFSPVPKDAPKTTGASIDVAKLVDLASEILSERENFNVSFEGTSDQDALTDILRVGTSAGGARAKAVIAWNPTTNDVRSGQVQAGDGYEYWLLKFDGVEGNKDRELKDPGGYGAIEYAYFRMAKDCGIEIKDCRLMEENDRRHFMTRRFDRKQNGDKVHMQSLGALAHFDLNSVPGSYSYEQAMQVIKKLGLPMASIEEQYRRVAFNVVGRNQDDHVKNIAFLMDKSGKWSLSPAFDMTYSFNPAGKWTGSHQMSMNGKQDDYHISDFEEFAKTVSMKRGRARHILDEVLAVFSNWSNYADEAGVPEEMMNKIQNALRVSAW